MGIGHIEQREAIEKRIEKIKNEITVLHNGEKKNIDIKSITQNGLNEIIEISIIVNPKEILKEDCNNCFYQENERNKPPCIACGYMLYSNNRSCWRDKDD